MFTYIDQRENALFCMFGSAKASGWMPHSSRHYTMDERNRSSETPMLPGMLLNLCQIANSLTEQCEHETFQISGFWADDGLPGNNLCKMACPPD